MLTLLPARCRPRPIDNDPQDLLAAFALQLDVENVEAVTSGNPAAITNAFQRRAHESPLKHKKWAKEQAHSGFPDEEPTS